MGVRSALRSAAGDLGVSLARDARNPVRITLRRQALERPELALAAQHRAHREEVRGARDVVHAHDRGARVDARGQRRQRPGVAIGRRRGR